MDACLFQLCYAATKDNNSYEVRVISQGATSSQSKIIAQCSAGTTILDNDITCYTSVAQVKKLTSVTKKIFLTNFLIKISFRCFK